MDFSEHGIPFGGYTIDGAADSTSDTAVSRILRRPMLSARDRSFSPRPDERHIGTGNVCVVAEYHLDFDFLYKLLLL